MKVTVVKHAYKSSTKTTKRFNTKPDLPSPCHSFVKRARSDGRMKEDTEEGNTFCFSRRIYVIGKVEEHISRSLIVPVNGKILAEYFYKKNSRESSTRIFLCMLGRESFGESSRFFVYSRRYETKCIFQNVLGTITFQIGVLFCI